MSRKNRLEELAIFGSQPAFGEKLHVGRPNIGNREILLARINNLLDERWLTKDVCFSDYLSGKSGPPKNGVGCCR